MASLSAGAFTGAIMSVVAALESITGANIAFIDRPEGDTQKYMNQVAEAVCRETNNPRYCARDFRGLMNSATLLGNARTLKLKQNDRVCIIIPPKNNIPSGYVSTHLGGEPRIDMPTNNEMEAWLALRHAATCAGHVSDGVTETQKDIFASLALTLIQGDTSFVSNRDLSPGREMARVIATERGRNVGRKIERGTAVGERLLLDLWKKQTADELDDLGCYPDLQRSNELPAAEMDLKRRLSTVCSRTQTERQTWSEEEYDGPAPITDANLHLWMSKKYRLENNTYSRNNGSATDGSAPVVGEPPKAYEPFQASFNGDIDAGTRYVWRKSGRLGR